MILVHEIHSSPLSINRTVEITKIVYTLELFERRNSLLKESVNGTTLRSSETLAFDGEAYFDPESELLLPDASRQQLVYGSYTNGAALGGVNEAVSTQHARSRRLVENQSCGLAAARKCPGRCYIQWHYVPEGTASSKSAERPSVLSVYRLRNTETVVAQLQVAATNELAPNRDQRNDLGCALQYNIDFTEAEALSCRRATVKLLAESFSTRSGDGGREKEKDGQARKVS
ncbi:hypothetical protein PENSPDRAFT_719380 [Peniophora sp. CONT]|nr:hypothetical protein PENSPDRAFT_719380 [Peniophora sp. CONT]